MFDLEDNRQKVQRALLVGIQMPGMTGEESQRLLEELSELTTNLDIPIVDEMIVKLRQTSPAYLVGKGKREEMLERVRDLNIDVIIFDEELSPAQQRNWERESNVCVIDRQEVIMDIFSERAQTREAVLQVALARMEYSLPRLTRAWTHLSRQRGGVTGARGQGETQLEADRRIVNDRITNVKRELNEVIKRRQVQRAKRMRKPVPTVSIVGYTNAGKSSLLNRLTNSDALAEDKLFATLDPTTRRLDLDDSQHALLTDTVGFVRRLPHRLVEAFKATLEEAVVADLLIHLIDVSNPEFESHSETTESVLSEIGAESNPRIVVFNKVDLLDDPEERERLRLLHKDALFVSAKTGYGMDALKARISERLNAALRFRRIAIPHDRYDIISKLHASGGVIQTQTDDEGVIIEGRFPESLDGLIKPFLSG